MGENKPAVPPRAREQRQAGGKDERLRKHRIGHLRLQACGGCDHRGWIAFAIPFIPNAVRVRDTRGRSGGKADLKN
jgi:hypothetical protein